MITAQCECEVAEGFWSDVQECLDVNGVDPVFQACECGVFGGFPELAEPLTCLASASEAFGACVEPLECSDYDGFDACYVADADAEALCPPFPGNYPVGQAYVECLGYPAFTCGGGQQIPSDWLCDYEKDCPDGSDEEGCPGFVCGSGETIPPEWQCDGFGDCQDNSDEENCPTFLCGSGEEIPLSAQCDFFPDCMDESDEAMCPDSFHCGSGEYIPVEWKCDSEPDCEDGSDEEGC